MKYKHLPFREISDTFGLRVIATSIDSCYRTLGVAHCLYKPLTEKFKDYIALPKNNGYQSLHTALFGPKGVPIELQIRTTEMDDMANYGISAHWIYKSPGALSQSQLQEQQWLQSLIEIQKQTGNSLEFIENVKVNLFPDEIFVFTPKGKIVELPLGATALDFAYAVHSEIGHNCVAAKIERQVAPLSTQLSSGQTVEIITTPTSSPSPNWLNIVTTGKATSLIKHYLKNKKNKESKILGYNMLQQSLRKDQIDINSLTTENKQAIANKNHNTDFNELLTNIGLGNISSQMTAKQTKEILNPEKEKRLTKQQEQTVFISGTEDMVVSIAPCCMPIPGESIAGVMKSGSGLIIHHTECERLKKCIRQKQEIIPVEWAKDISGDFMCKIRVQIYNQRGT